VHDKHQNHAQNVVHRTFFMVLLFHVYCPKRLMIVLGPYIAPGAPPPVQMQASNTASGSVHGLHLRKLG
jgi:hypothetical protein